MIAHGERVVSHDVCGDSIEICHIKSVSVGNTKKMNWEKRKLPIINVNHTKTIINPS